MFRATCHWLADDSVFHSTQLRRLLCLSGPNLPALLSASGKRRRAVVLLLANPCRFCCAIHICGPSLSVYWARFGETVSPSYYPSESVRRRNMFIKRQCDSRIANFEAFSTPDSVLSVICLSRFLEATRAIFRHEYYANCGLICSSMLLWLFHPAVTTVLVEQIVPVWLEAGEAKVHPPFVFKNCLPHNHTNNSAWWTVCGLMPLRGVFPVVKRLFTALCR